MWYCYWIWLHRLWSASLYRDVWKAVPGIHSHRRSASGKVDNKRRFPVGETAMLKIQLFGRCLVDHGGSPIPYFPNQQPYLIPNILGLFGFTMLVCSRALRDDIAWSYGARFHKSKVDDLLCFEQILAICLNSCMFNGKATRPPRLMKRLLTRRSFFLFPK